MCATGSCRLDDEEIGKSTTSISKALEAEDVLVVVLGKEEGCSMPLRTRRR
jgi:hypothetical protein